MSKTTPIAAPDNQVILKNGDVLAVPSDATHWPTDRIQALARHSVQVYGGITEKFTNQQEATLASRITLANAVRVLGSVGIEGLSPHTVSLSVIPEGAQAELALFEANLGFALFFSRESVGIKRAWHQTAALKARRAAYAEAAAATNTPKASFAWMVGTFIPLSELMSPHASLEDRQAQASIGLLKAVRRLRYSTAHEAHPLPSRFVTFAAWHIQKHLNRERHTTEHGGVRLPERNHEYLEKYFREHETMAVDETSPEDIGHLIRITTPATYPDSIFQPDHLSREMLNDPVAENDTTSELADRWPDTNNTEERDIAHRAAQRILAKAFEAMETDGSLQGNFPKKAIRILMLRHGVISCGCHPREQTAHTRVEVGTIVGLTATRVQQLETRILDNIRDSKHMPALRDALDSYAEADRLPASGGLNGDGSLSLRGARQECQPEPEYQARIYGRQADIDHGRYEPVSYTSSNVVRKP